MVQQGSIQIPKDLEDELRRGAEASGLDIAAYLRLLQTANQRGHDREFLDAAKKTFKQYPNAMRDLNQ